MKKQKISLNLKLLKILGKVSAIALLVFTTFIISDLCAFWFIQGLQAIINWGAINLTKLFFGIFMAIITFIIMKK